MINLAFSLFILQTMTFFFCHSLYFMSQFREVCLHCATALLFFIYIYKKVRLSNRKGYSIPCHSKTRILCCKQVRHTNSSAVTTRTYNIYNTLKCKNSYFIYLMECTLCKRQYTDKSET